MRSSNELLRKQFLIACDLPSHPNHHIVMNNPTPRRIRHDFTSYNTDTTQLILLIVDLQSVRKAQRYLHQTTVTTTMDEFSHYRVINWNPPPIAENERQLPKVTRTILAQLSSGWANILNRYRTRITPRTLRSHAIKHYMTHLFSCPSKPTTLRLIS